MVTFIGVCPHNRSSKPELDIYVISPSGEFRLNSYTDLLNFLQNSPEQCVGLVLRDYDIECCRYDFAIALIDEQLKFIDKVLKSMGTTLNVLDPCMNSQILNHKITQGHSCKKCQSKPGGVNPTFCARNCALELQKFYKEVDPARVPAKCALEAIRPPPVPIFQLENVYYFVSSFHDLKSRTSTRSMSLL